MSKSTFPDAVESVDNSMYVDDPLDSDETVQSTKLLHSQLSDMFCAAGFNLQKWASNEPAFLENVPPANQFPPVELNDGISPKTRTLGVLWEANHDIFIFKIKAPDPSIAPTKQTVLSAIASHYDLLQFLPPFLIRAKILMQQIWIKRLNTSHIIRRQLLAVRPATASLIIWR